MSQDKPVLSPCPFCGGAGELQEMNERSGYGEYERTIKSHLVGCQKCRAHGTAFVQKALIDYTSYTVSDFRNNPVLRAKVEDEYEAYAAQTKELAVEAWNRRALSAIERQGSGKWDGKERRKQPGVHDVAEFYREENK